MNELYEAIEKKIKMQVIREKSLGQMYTTIFATRLTERKTELTFCYQNLRMMLYLNIILQFRTRILTLVF